jgi:hypothetical protein
MAKLIYNSEDLLNKEAQKIKFVISDDLDIYEFKLICVRMASAMGYHYKSIERAFGNSEKYIKKQKHISDLVNVMEYSLTGSKH